LVFGRKRVAATIPGSAREPRDLGKGNSAMTTPDTTTAIDTDADRARQADFEDFKNGKWPVYVVVGREEKARWPMFRKLDDQRIAIVAWRDKAKADVLCLPTNSRSHW